MAKPQLQLVQVFPPLVGGLLVFTLEGAELGEVVSWQWQLEEANAGKTHWQGIKGNASGVKIELAHLHKRIRAEVLLSGQRRVSAISFPVLHPEEYSKDISLQSLRELADSIIHKTPEYKAASKELLARKQEFEMVNQIPQKLARLEQLAIQVKADRQEIEDQRSALSQERAELDRDFRNHKDMVAMEWEQIRKTWEDLKNKEKEFNSDFVLQRALDEKRAELSQVRQLWERVENAWDAIDKARHLKVVLTDQNLEDIMAIVASATEEKRISRKIETLADRGNSKSCHHYATSSSLGGWAGVCADCSK